MGSNPTPSAILFVLRPTRLRRWLITVRAFGPWRLRLLAESVYARCGATCCATEPIHGSLGTRLLWGMPHRCADGDPSPIGVGSFFASRGFAGGSSLFGLLDRGASACLRSRFTLAAAPRVVQPNLFMVLWARGSFGACLIAARCGTTCCTTESPSVPRKTRYCACYPPSSPGSSPTVATWGR